MIPGSANPLLLRSAAVTGYQIQRSLRFNSSDSAYLSRTPASTGNQKKWTYSIWVKRSKISESYNSPLLSTAYATAGNKGVDFNLNTSDGISIGFYNSSGGNYWELTTTQVFRDVSAWYHFLVAVDTDQSTASNRVKLYVNGSQITAFSTATYPVQGDSLEVNSTETHYIGCLNLNGTPQRFFNGYVADVHLIDGQQLDPSSFTEVSATTGQLIPKAYTGSFGTNGFWLKFSDNSAATATTLGKDYSGNGNNWTPNNLSVTAGAGNDSLVDTPTSYGTDTGAGNEVRGNYCTWNPLANSATLTNGNLDCANGAASWQTTLSTIAVSSGKWFAELTLTTHSVTNSGIHFGIAATSYSPAAGNYLGNTSASYAYRSVVGEATGSKVNSNSFTGYGAVSTQGDVVGLALDLDVGTLTFYKNGVSQGQAFSGISGTFVIALSVYNAAGSVNFGQRPFAYTAPSGFKALCDTNLPAPVVAKPSTVMDVKLWTGNGSGQTVSGLGFSPDFVWIKQRSAARHNWLFDVVRGAGIGLRSDTTNSENTNDVDGYLSALS